MINVYDTSAILNRFSFDSIDKAYISASAVSEVIDFSHRLILDNKINSGKIIVINPSKTYLDYVKSKYSKTRLSNVDLDVLSLAFEHNAILHTDDSLLRKCGVQLGLNVESMLYSAESISDNNDLYKEIYDKIKPTESENKKIKQISDEIISELYKSSRKLDLDVKEILLAGSASRSTYLRDSKDLDIFLLFDLNVDSKELEYRNLSIIKDAYPDLKLEVDYAQHPYFIAKLSGYDIEFVPGYSIDNIQNRKSAVDRTPLHLKYLKERLTKNMTRDILILKQFLSNNLLYGADSIYNGFAGYLSEIIILHYGSFNNFLNALLVNPEYIKIRFNFEPSKLNQYNSPLVVLDPVDDERNVGASLSKRNFLILKYLAKEFAKNPKKEFFFGNVYPKLDLSESVIFEIEMTESKTLDSLWGAMRSKLEIMDRLLDQKYIKISRKSLAISDKIYFIIEFDKNPYVHKGPMLQDAENIKIFKSKHPKTYLDDQRMYAKISLDLDDKINEVTNILDKFGLKSNVIKTSKFIKMANPNMKKVISKDYLVF